MDLTTGIVFGEDYYGDEVNELAVASFNYVKQDIADVKKRYMSLGFHLHEMEMRRYHEELGYDNFYECIEKNFHMDKSAVSRVICGMEGILLKRRLRIPGRCGSMTDMRNIPTLSW